MAANSSYGGFPPKRQEQGCSNLWQNLEKHVWMKSLLGPATLPKMNFFLGIFEGFYLKDCEEFFHRTPPCIAVVIVNRLCKAFLR